MTKILNAVLCVACFAGVVAIILTHGRVTAADDPSEANGYFGGGSNWSSVSTDSAPRVPGNPFIIGSSDGHTAGSLTPSERAQGLERWNELRQIAADAPPATTARTVNTRKLNRERDAALAKTRAEKQASKTKNRSYRRSRTLFEQSDHYHRYADSYRNKNNKQRRRGLPPGRGPRSRYR